MNVEVRAEGTAVIKGYVNVPGLLSREIYRQGKRFKETIAKGAFENAIKRAKLSGRRIPLLKDHDKKEPLASTDGGLVLKEDNVGLYAEAEISNPDVIDRAKNEEVRGWSFGFIPKKQRFANGVREVEDLDLTEVSVIFDKNPVYTETSFELEEQRAEDADEVMCVDVSGKAYADSYKRRLTLAKLI